jgi:hypothetical protein
MKIEHIELGCVRIPLVAPFRNSFGSLLSAGAPVR